MTNRTPPRRVLCTLALTWAVCVASALAMGSRHSGSLAPSLLEVEAETEMTAAAALLESDQCEGVDPSLFLVGGKPQGGSKNFKLDPLHISTIHSFDQLTSAMKAEEAAKKHEHIAHRQRMAALHKARAEEEKREEKEDRLDLAKIEAEVYAAEDRKHRERGQPVGEDDLMFLEEQQSPRGVPSGVARAVMSGSSSGEFDRSEVRPDSMPSAVSASAQSGQRYVIKDSPQPIEAVREALVRAATASISSMLGSSAGSPQTAQSTSESAGPSQAAAMDAVLRDLMEADKAQEANPAPPSAPAPSPDAVIAQAVARAQSPGSTQVKSVEEQWPNPYKYAVSAWSNSPSKKDLEAQRKFDEWRREGHKGPYSIEYHGNDGPCCEGLKCPFQNGVCCISLNSCCPEGSECTRNAYGAVLCRRQQRFPKSESASSSSSQSSGSSSQSVQSQSWSSYGSLSSAWHPAASASLQSADLPPMATAQSVSVGTSSGSSASVSFGSQSMAASAQSESVSELPLGSWKRLALARKELLKLRHVKNFNPSEIDAAMREAKIRQAVAQQKLDLVKEFDLTLGNYKLTDDNDNDYQRKGNPYKTHRNYFRRVPRSKAKSRKAAKPARAAPAPVPAQAPAAPAPVSLFAPPTPTPAPAPAAPAPMSDIDSALATVAAMAQQPSLIELETLPPAKAKKLGPKKQKTKVTINVVPDPNADKIDINARLGTFQDDDDLNEEWRDQLKEDIDVAQLLRQPYCYAETKKGIIRTMLTPISCLNFTTKLNTFGSWALDSSVADPAALMGAPAPGYGATEASKITDVLGATTVTRTEFKAFNFGPDTTWSKAQEKCVTAGFAGLCPAEIVCEPSAKNPTETEVNSVLQKLPVRNNMWVPIADEENEWMQANPSDHRACERYSRTFGDKPVWGNDPTTPKTVRGAVLCCKNVFVRSAAFFGTTPNRVCWGNKKNTFATVNIKGEGKYIQAVRLEHFSGGHACLARHTPERFGCDGYINTYLASNDSTPQVIYPQTNEPGVIFKPFARQHYKLGGGQTSSSPILNLIPRTLIPTRTQGDTALRIYSGDDLFGIFDPSAAGITCANVYVLYNGTQVTEVDNTQNVDLFKPSFEFSAFSVPPFKIDPADEEEDDERLPSARDQRFKNPYALEDPLREAANKENPTFKAGKTQMRVTVPYCVRSSKTWLRMFVEYNTTKCPGPAQEKGEWKQEFVFYAFQHFFPGTVPFCIRESTSPSAPPRHTIATGTNTCGTKHFKQIGVFYAYDNVKPSEMPPIDLDENNQPVPYLGKNPQVPAHIDPAAAAANASTGATASSPALTPAGAAAFTPPPAPNPLVEKIAPVDNPPPTQVMPITSQMDQHTFEWDSSKGVPGNPWKMFK